MLWFRISGIASSVRIKTYRSLWPSLKNIEIEARISVFEITRYKLRMVGMEILVVSIIRNEGETRGGYLCY